MLTDNQQLIKQTRDSRGRFKRREMEWDVRTLTLCTLIVIMVSGVAIKNTINEMIAANTIVYVAEASEAEDLEVHPAPVEEIVWDRETIKKEVWAAAKRYNTYPERMWNVMLCENDTLEPTRQSHHVYSFTDERRGIYAGEREMSFGLSQIHLPDHDVTYEQAVDPAFAIDFMAKHFANGNARWWTCYKLLY